MRQPYHGVCSSVLAISRRAQSRAMKILEQYQQGKMV